MKKLLALGIAFVSAGWSAAPNKYEQHNLVSDLAGMADRIDPCLVNPWGIVATATSPFWISDNGTGLSTLYNGNGVPSALVVSVPGPAGATAPTQQCGASAFGPGAPSGIIVNDTSSFVAGASPASFIFSSEQGLVVGWNGAAGKAGVIMADRSAAGAVYKGLATATRSEGPLLYAADFGNGKIDVYDGRMNLLSLPGAFADPRIPSGFAPFNIANLGGSLYVSYAKQNAEHHDDVAGPGNGYVDVYDLNGLLLSRLVSAGPLNSPWAMVKAPASFGAFGGALLVGNFGDGAINAFDPVTGTYLGALQNGSGATIHISGLWGLTFGNGAQATPAAVPAGGDANTLYFAAGIAGPDTVESHGLLGTIQPAPAVALNGVVNAASFSEITTPGAFTAIFGTGLAATTRTWTTSDFLSGRLPVQLDGVSVTIDGKPAYVYFVSPNQIDVIAPPDSTTGAVPVVVTNNNVPSVASAVQLNAAAPAFFAAGKYVVATHANGSLVGPVNVLPGSTPAKPGETIVVYGTGFGATNPAVDGLVVTSAAALATPPAVKVGGSTAAVAFAGLSSAGLDQINLTIPTLPAGTTGTVDLPIVATAGGSSTQSGLFVTVQSGN
ncbi:MAG: TIGR03118 family protein [Acidobacteriota bacterium]|nr:TIGR03118 family protein [Acidobacteriota bacterium]